MTTGKRGAVRAALTTGAQPRAVPCAHIGLALGMSELRLNASDPESLRPPGHGSKRERGVDRHPTN
jgi:hypothetical protein